MTQQRRRDRGDGSVFQRKDGQHVATLDLGYADGKRRRKVVYGRTRSEALRKLKDLKLQLAERGDLPTADITVEKWLTYWLDNVAADRVKPSTLGSYRVSVRQYLIPSIGKHRLAKLGAQHVREMHRYVIGKGKSSTTAANAHRILAVALHDAQKERRIGENVASLVSAPRNAVPTRTNLTVTDAKKVIKAADLDKRLGSRWLAAFLLGLRQGERLGLRWSYLDLDNGAADVAWSLQSVKWAHGCVPPGTPPTCGTITRACPAKRLPIPEGMPHEVLDGNLVLLPPKTSGSRRIIPLPEPMRLALLRHRDVMAAETHTVDHDLVWCRPNGRPIHPREDWEDWRALLATAKVPIVTGHEARHTTATLLMEGGVDPHVIAQILGHSSILTTRAYQHVSVALARTALTDLSAQLELD